MTSAVLPVFVGILIFFWMIAFVVLAALLLRKDMRSGDDGPDPSVMCLAVVLVTFLPTVGGYLWSAW